MHIKDNSADGERSENNYGIDEATELVEENCLPDQVDVPGINAQAVAGIKSALDSPDVHTNLHVLSVAVSVPAVRWVC